MNKTKSWLKTAIAALTILLITAVAFGISGAWYASVKRATGTINLNEGIIIDYSGFGQGSGTWSNNSATFSLFSTDGGLLPGATVSFNETSIKANSSSADFFARVKLEYKFFTDLAGEYEVTSQISDYSAFINTPTFANGWVDSNNDDGWFYYATGTTFNVFPKSYVNILASGSTLQLNGDAAGFFHEGGGYQYSNEILIKRIEVVLTLEAYQANQTAAANAGWEIAPPVIQNSSGQVVRICSNQITLGNMGGAYKLGTGEAGSLNTGSLTDLKIVVEGDSQINANAFDSSALTNIYIGNEEYINGLSSYAAKIYTSTPTFTIGTNAFNGCSSLDIYLSSSINYNIYASSLVGANNVYYDGVLTNGLKSPSVGAVSGTTITVLANPSIVTGGSGAGAVNQVSDSKGEYTYEDASGNIWYFDLGTISADGQTWTKNNTTGTQAQVRYCDMIDKNTQGQSLTIPSLVSYSEITNIQVVEIRGPGTGHSFASNNGLLTSITIPNSVISIGYQAFRDCNLTSIAISSFVISIGTEAFKDCYFITSITIPNSVKYIGSGAFQHCQITSITIPNLVTSIEHGAFANCASLTSFSGENSKYQIIDNGRCLVEVDGNNQTLIAFAPYNVSTYTIPSSVKSIKAAFSGCTGLTSITIPNSVTSIGASAFFSCSSLTSVTIPNSVTSIGISAFSNCRGLTSVTIPSSVTSIGSQAFRGCTGLTSITIPNSVTSIDNEAFSGCTGLTSITIPNLVMVLDAFTFQNCTSLTTVIINGNIVFIGQYCFSGCTSLIGVTLPVSVTYIGNYAFNKCPGLQSINWSASYNLGAEKNNEVVTLAKATTGLTLGDINLPDATDLAAASITAPTGKVFAGWSDGTTTYTTTAPIATVCEGLTAVWENE